jgi:hypothetical protein
VQAELDAVLEGVKLVNEKRAFQRELAHMTLEGLGAEDLGRMVEIGQVRREVLGMIGEYRGLGGRFEVGAGPIGRLVADGE